MGSLRRKVLIGAGVFIAVALVVGSVYLVVAAHDAVRLVRIVVQPHSLQHGVTLFGGSTLADVRPGRGVRIDISGTAPEVPLAAYLLLETRGGTSDWRPQDCCVGIGGPFTGTVTLDPLRDDRDIDIRLTAVHTKLVLATGVVTMQGYAFAGAGRWQAATVGIIGLLSAVAQIVQVLVLLVRARGGPTASQRPHPPRKRRRTTAVAAMILFALAACGQGQPPPPPPPSTASASAPTGPPAPDPQIAITAPAEGGQVGHIDVVSGTAKHLPDGRALWAVIRPTMSPRLHPQAGPIGVDTTGRWSIACTFGLPDQAGLQFAVLIVVANAGAQQQFNTYLAGAASANFPGMGTMPPGATQVAAVTVTRR
jgi:hypothetical protein